MKAKSRSTCVFIVANSLLHRTLVLFILDLLLQNRNGPILGLKKCAKLLKHRLIRGCASVEKCLWVEIIVRTILIRMISDAWAPTTTAIVGQLSTRSIIRSISRPHPKRDVGEHHGEYRHYQMMANVHNS